MEPCRLLAPETKASASTRLVFPLAPCPTTATFRISELLYSLIGGFLLGAMVPRGPGVSKVCTRSVRVTRSALRVVCAIRTARQSESELTRIAHCADHAQCAARSGGHISLPTSGASASIRRRSSSVVSARRNREGAAIARVGSRASLRQEKRSASWALPEKTALHRRPA